MKEKILLFDLDGTLIDSTDAILESFLKTTKFYGIDLDERRDEVCALIGMTLSDMFLKMGVINEKIDECIKIYRGYYREVFLEKTHLLPKVKEALEALPNTYKMAVVTSKSHFFSEKILENLKILKYFFTIVGIEDTEEPKPSAQPILKALEGIDYGQSKVFMIGDTLFDMQAAQNAGVIGIGVRGKYQKDLEKYTPFVFEDIAAALDYIKEQE
ncbi:HAD family hydrolase [Helicobacter kayseriensis]|uniref:HAD family hydrolase n=1 Tax=Helicobacter kayseriensis TaxID=2905877 RepID=UPI001E33BDD6|nr:HAD family hydrolase [Helicobacter kayseriensis]MCE3047374.1 HAD family hydrolase [Helicobacter kayseriensis]MCE3048745.1 HAD family hydrolase [Helicobacter kayseriensis]